MNRTLTRVATAIAALAAAATVALPALASTSPAPTPAATSLAATTDTGITRCLAQWTAVTTDRTLADVQAAGECEIDRRLDTITHLKAVVSGSQVLTSSHAGSLDTILDNTASGLTTLRATLAADTTMAAATADVRRIFTDYRVYVLVGRQVALVTADDRVTVAADRLGDAAGKLADAIAQAAARGKDVTAAQGHLDAMNAAIAAARGEVAGDADGVLAQTPSSWNAGTAKPVLDAARASISAARTDLRTAVSEARAVLVALR